MPKAQELAAAVGRSMGSSDWIEIGQERIDRFAGVTDDRQDIHLDGAAARAAGFAGPVAHGFLTLSMLSVMSYQVLAEVSGAAHSVNYGFDRIRFVAPVLAGARIRGHFTLSEVAPRGQGHLLRFAVTVEIEGQEKPALTADWRVYLA